MFILLLKSLNVRRFPPPSSPIYQRHYIGVETREEGGTRCQRALAAEGDGGAEEIGQQEEAEAARGGGAGAMEEQVGRKARCCAPCVRQLVEDRAAVCPGFLLFFSSLPSLVSVTPHPSVSFSLASSVLTPRYAAAALTGSPQERGEGGSRAQSREYPPGLRGAMGVCDEWGGAESRGNGARPVE